VKNGDKRHLVRLAAVPKDKQLVSVNPDDRRLFIEAYLVKIVPQVAAAVPGAEAKIKHALKHPLQGMAAPTGPFLGPLYGVMRWNQL
jgi:hypothetical protein